MGKKSTDPSRWDAISPDAVLRLEKVRITARKSQTSVCFVAGVTCDGVRRGQVTSAGDGSPLVFVPSELESLVARLSGSDAPSAMMRVLQEYEDERDYALRIRRQRVLFVRAGTLRQTGRIESFNAFVEKKAELEAKHPGDVLNNMPFHEALARFRAMVPIPIPTHPAPDSK
jgi:hypothetical protein